MNGNILDYKDFCDKFNFSPPFTQYLGLCKAVKENCENLNFSLFKCNQPYCHQFVLSLVKLKKGTRNISDIFVKKLYRKPASEYKWQQKMECNFDDFWWKKCNTQIFKCTKDVKLRWFQFRIVHRILSTNQFLKKIQIADSDLCSFCHEMPETLIHIFCKCRFVTCFWENFQLWLNDKFHLNLKITILEIIFGYFSQNNEILNLCIILAKFHIYKQKLRNSLPCVEGVKKEIFYYKRIEEYIFKTKFQYGKFLQKWGLLHEIDM